MITAMCKTLLFSLCFLACRKSATTGNPVTIRLSECAGVQRSSGALRICLDSLSDSRCPANAVCVWAGVAVVKLSVTVNNKVYSFKLSTAKSAAFPPADTSVANHRFGLSKVLPYPGTGGNTPSYIELTVD